MNANRTIAGLAALFVIGAVMIFPNPAIAHCDGMDGPVVKAAQKALASGDVNLVLIWVQKEDEAEIRRAFDRTLAVRKLGVEARDLADMYFFETLVRIHRTGEGAPYTGLKPAGRDLGPAIPLADQVLATGKIDPLVKLITDETAKGLNESFNHVLKVRNYSPSDIDAGREYVRAYVTFIHYVERAYEAASHPVAGHFAEEEQVPERHDK
jgi:hypothetical protein